MSGAASPWAPLVDSHGRKHDYLRLSLTDRCNFRCQYCMPEEGVQLIEHKEILTFEEIERLVGVFARLGVNKLRLTGGEPTVRKGLVDLVGRVARIEGIKSLLMTTNAWSFRTLAPELKAAGLTGVNISLDSLIPEKFHKITRRDGLAQVLEGIETALSVGLATKINVVVLPGLNEDELCDFVEFVRHRDAQVRFIEFMPFAGNLWHADRVFGFAEMKAEIQTRYALEPIPGQPSDVAKEFRVEGFRGTVGFVTSMTDSFCSGCNRLRVTAEGRMKTCLFLPTRSSLRDMMRAGASDEDLANAIRADLMTKWAAHPPMAEWRNLEPLSMVQIGG